MSADVHCRFGGPDVQDSDSLYAKRKQWAHRWTWASTTHGQSATSRGEGAFGGLKMQYTKGNMTLTDLLASVDAFDAEKDTKSAVSRVKALLRLAGQSLGAQEPALIRNLASAGATPFLLSVARAQMNESLHYTFLGPLYPTAAAADGADPDGIVYLIQRDETRTGPVGLGNDAEEEVDPELLMREDMGLGGGLRKGMRAHHVTRKSCSCQFPTHMGCPCRHIFKLYSHLDIKEMPMGLLSPLWLMKDDDAALLPNLQRLMRDYQPTSKPRAAPHLTVAERRAELLSLTKERACALCCLRPSVWSHN